MVVRKGDIKVLIVDDDEELRTALTENLRLNGIIVREVENGAAFRDVLRMDRMDVAIIDVNLPDISGFELARELSEKIDRPGIILLTARAERSDRLQGYLEGADIYMTKPVDNDELVLVVRNLSGRLANAQLSSQPKQAPKPGWKLDVGRKLLISPDDRIVVLSGREVMLMELFEKAGGATLSRSYIASVMGYGQPGPEHRGFDAALRRLKEKATRAQVDIPLLSVKSMGIRFVAPLMTID